MTSHDQPHPSKEKSRTEPAVAEWLHRCLETPAEDRRASDETRAELLSEVESRLDEFAARIHAAYMTLPEERRSPDITKEFEKLEPLAKESNRMAARRIPRALAAAGLRMVPGGGRGAASLAEAQAWLDRFLDLAAAEEHRGWCEFHEAEGWVPTESQDDPKDPHARPPRHPALVPWEELGEHNRDKDRAQVRLYLAIVYDMDFGVTWE